MSSRETMAFVRSTLTTAIALAGSFFPARGTSAAEVNGPPQSGSTAVSLTEKRVWTSANRQFSVRAELLGFSADETGVRLRTEDGREVIVPLIKLSDEDQDYAGVRDWKSNSGYTFRGRMVSHNPQTGEVVLSHAVTGNKTTVAIGVLSDGDQRYVKDLSTKNNGDGAAALNVPPPDVKKLVGEPVTQHREAEQYCAARAAALKGWSAMSPTNKPLVDVAVFLGMADFNFMPPNLCQGSFALVFGLDAVRGNVLLFNSHGKLASMLIGQNDDDAETNFTEPSAVAVQLGSRSSCRIAVVDEGDVTVYSYAPGQRWKRMCDIAGGTGGQSPQAAKGVALTARDLFVAGNGSVKVYTCNGGRFVREVGKGVLTDPHEVAVAPDGVLAVSQEGGSVSIFSKEGELIAIAPAQTEGRQVDHVAFVGGKLLVIAGESSAVYPLSN